MSILGLRNRAPGKLWNRWKVYPGILIDHHRTKLVHVGPEVSPAREPRVLLDTLYKVSCCRVGVVVGDHLDGRLKVRDLDNAGGAGPDVEVLKAEQAFNGIGEFLLDLHIEAAGQVGVFKDGDYVGVVPLPEVVADIDFKVALGAGEDAGDEQFHVVSNG